MGGIGWSGRRGGSARMAAVVDVASVLRILSDLAPDRRAVSYEVATGASNPLVWLGAILSSEDSGNPLALFEVMGSTDASRPIVTPASPALDALIRYGRAQPSTDDLRLGWAWVVGTARRRRGRTTVPPAAAQRTRARRGRIPTGRQRSPDPARPRAVGPLAARVRRRCGRAGAESCVRRRCRRAGCQRADPPQAHQASVVDRRGPAGIRAGTDLHVAHPRPVAGRALRGGRDRVAHRLRSVRRRTARPPSTEARPSAAGRSTRGRRQPRSPRSTSRAPARHRRPRRPTTGRCAAPCRCRRPSARWSSGPAGNR